MSQMSHTAATGTPRRKLDDQVVASDESAHGWAAALSDNRKSVAEETPPEEIAGHCRYRH
ncbi:hypothetical protein GCM10028801_33780 [Nocardioides maradonensis]